jgi:hypothetical protein
VSPGDGGSPLIVTYDMFSHGRRNCKPKELNAEKDGSRAAGVLSDDWQRRGGGGRDYVRRKTLTTEDTRFTGAHLHREYVHRKHKEHESSRMA